MPQVNEQEFKKILSGGEYGNLFYICGSEKMLVSHYTNKLIEKTAGKKPSDFNFHIFTGEFDINEFASSIQAIPFTSDYNVTVVRDLNFSDFSASDGDKILELVKNISGDSIVIFTYPTAVQKSRSSLSGKDKKLAELAVQRGCLLEIEKLTPYALQKKLISWAGKRGITLSPKNAELIVNYSGTDLNLLRNELEKLCEFVGTGGEITENEIDMLVTKNMEASIYDLSKAVISGNAAKAFKLVDRLIYQKEEIISILAVLSSSYINMYRARIAIKCGYPVTDLMKFFPGAYKSARSLSYIERDCRKVNTAILRKSLDAIAQTDIALKSTRADEKIQLERLIVKLMMIVSEG